MRHDAMPKECMFEGTLRAVKELIWQNDVARFVFGLKRANRTDAEDPLHAQFLHRPNVRAMVQLARKNSMPTRVAREKDNFAPGKPSGEQLIRGRAERCFDRHPLLVRNP